MTTPAARPQDQNRGKLPLEPGTPIGRLVRTSFDQNDAPIEVYVVILPGNKHILLYDVDAS